MATDSPEPAPKKVFRIHRFAIGLNVLVQILALLFILAAVNYFSFKHFRRLDLSQNQKYVLSDQTKQLLASLKQPVKIYELFIRDPRVPGADVAEDVDALLREYQYAAHGKVDLEYVDPFKNLSRAKALMTQYKFGFENVLVIVCGDHSKLVNFTDMADYNETPDDEEETQQPTIRDFKGEQAITSALIEVTEGTTNNIYLVGGKGGPELDSDDLAMIKLYLERQNLKLIPIELMNSTAIPDDAKAVMIIGAKYDLTDREIKLVRDYWDKQGRLFIALDPTANAPHLTAFLRECGINPEDDRVLRTMAIGPMTALVRDVAGTFADTSPITSRLKGVETVIAGQTQSLALSQLPLVRTDPLITAGEGYWGETKYQDMETTGAIFDPKTDISAPLVIAASAEKGAVPDASVNVETARMIVTGNADFFTSSALQQYPQNVDFVLAGVNWLINRQELVGIVPKDEQQFALELTDQQMFRVEMLVMGVMPLAVFMIGTFVWMRRRH